jgi:hypothetical protein
MGGKRVRQLGHAFARLQRNAQGLALEEAAMDNLSKEELAASVESMTAEITLLRSQMGDLQQARHDSAMKNMEKFVKMWQNKSLLSCFNSWRLGVEEQLRETKLLKHVLTRMCNVKLHSAFFDWQGMVHLAQQRETLGKRVLLRMSKVKEASAFSIWAAKVSYRASEASAKC